MRSGANVRRDDLRHAEGREQRGYVAQRQVARRELARVRKVVQQTTRTAVWRVHRAQEAPCFGQELAHGRRLELGEEGAAVHAAEVRDVAVKVELLGDNRKAADLLQIQARGRRYVARRKERREARANVAIHLGEGLLDVPRIEKVTLPRPHIARNELAHIDQVLVETLLDHGTIQQSWHEHLLVLRAVRVVRTALASHKCV